MVLEKVEDVFDQVFTLRLIIEKCPSLSNTFGPQFYRL